MSTSANRYVPFSLTETFETRSAAFAELTLAPLRFVPRTRSLTGLVVRLAHHDGGSTLVTVCAETEETKARTRNNLCSLWIEFMACVASRYHPQRSSAAAANSHHLSPDLPSASLRAY